MESTRSTTVVQLGQTQTGSGVEREFYRDSVWYCVCNQPIHYVIFNLRRPLGAAILTVVIFNLTLAASNPTPAKLLAEGRIDDAVLLLQSRIDRDPHDAESYNFLCRAYLVLGEWDLGIGACKKAVSIDPDNGEYHSWLGRIYGEKAEHSNFITAARLAGQVRNEFEVAVRLNPHNIDARADLADFYLEAPGLVGGGKEKAEAQAEAIAMVDPAQARRVKGRIAEENKDYVTAEKEYHAAIQLSGGKAGAWLNLAGFYRHVGRWDEMADAIGQATAPKMNRPDLLVGAAEMLIKARRNLPEASQLLRRYLASSATVEDAPVFKAHYLLGTILERQGDKQAAAEQYRAALSLAKSFSPARDALDHLKQQTNSE